MDPITGVQWPRPRWEPTARTCYGCKTIAAYRDSIPEDARDGAVVSLAPTGVDPDWQYGSQRSRADWAARFIDPDPSGADSGGSGPIRADLEGVGS